MDSHPAVFLYSHPEDIFSFLSDWFQHAKENAWRSECPTVFLTPNRPLGVYYKEKALTFGDGCLNLHFWTAEELVRFLIRKLSPEIRLARRELLPIYLALAAEELPDKNVVARDPESALRVFSKLAFAGLEPQQDDYLYDVYQSFLKKLEAAHLSYVPQVIASLIQRPGFSKIIQNLLVLGFSGEHWQQYFPLLLAAKSSEQSTFLLPMPEAETTEHIDQVWIGSLEEHLHTQHHVLPSNHGLDEHPENTTLFAKGLLDQVQAATAQTISFLKEPDARIGIVVPGPGVLAKEIAGQLVALKIPHNDTIAHYASGDFESPEWKQWLAFQRHPGCISFLEFARECPAILALGGQKPILFRHLKRQIIGSLDDIQIDDLKLFQMRLAESKNELAIRVANLLHTIPVLSDQAPFQEYISAVDTIFKKLGWDLQQSALRERAEDIPAGWIISRTLFVDWLEATFHSFERRRSAYGSHTFAKVQIIRYADAIGQSWSHLILTGLNENFWPLESEDSGHLTEARMIATNQRHKTIRQGEQGIGHEMLPFNRGWLLTPGEENGIADKQFNSLLSAGAKTVLIAGTIDETDTEHALLPARPLARWYQKRYQEPLRLETMQQCAENIQIWLDRSISRPAPVITSDYPVQKTGEAFKKRNDSESAYDEYSFCSNPEQMKEISLAAGTWENAIRKPGIAWMEHQLGIEEPLTELSDTTHKTLGSWTHRWLAAFSDLEQEIAPWQESADRNLRIEAKASDFRRKAVRLFEVIGIQPPIWWDSLLEESVTLAKGFSEGLNRGVFKGILTEYKFEKQNIQLPVDTLNSVLRLHGKADFLGFFAYDHAAKPSNFFGSRIAVIDYKTSKTRDTRISPGKLEEKGLQLALYLLLLKQNHVQEASADILGIGMTYKPDEPQLSLDDLLSPIHLWKRLLTMQNEGKFGMGPQWENEYSNPLVYPTAILPIKPHILNAKHALTFPETEKYS